MPERRYLPFKLMVRNLIRRFNRLNPNEEVDNLVFDCIDYPCSFESALHDMKYQYPQFVWFDEPNLFEIEGRIKEHEREELAKKLFAEGYDEKTVDRMLEEREPKILKRGWKEEWFDGQRIYTKTVPIKRHPQGKYLRGRIQVLCDPELIVLEAKITIVKPEKLNKESMEWEPDEYE